MTANTLTIAVCMNVIQYLYGTSLASYILINLVPRPRAKEEGEKRPGI